ncbi:hypothetical protein BH10ACT1_BH10ACT1_33420 [soil metagenome]
MEPTADPTGPGHGVSPQTDLDQAVEKSKALTAAGLAAGRVDRPAAEFGVAVRAAVAVGATPEEIAEVTEVSEMTIERMVSQVRNT